MKKSTFLFAAIVALASCTITKRHYAPGYHVQWKNAKATDRQSMPICNHDFDAQDFSKIKSSASMESSVLQELALSQNGYGEWSFVKSTFFQIEQVNNSVDSPEGFIDENQYAPEVQGTFRDLNVPTIFADTITDTSSEDNHEIEESKVNRTAIVGVILAYLGLPTLILSAIGIGLCFSALDEIKSNGGRGKTLAWFGIIGPIVIAIAYIVFFALAYGGSLGG